MSEWLEGPGTVTNASHSRALIQRHPVAIYFVLAFTIPWASTLVVAGPKLMSGEAVSMSDLMLTLISMLAGPSIAGIALTGVVDGRGGALDLFSRMVIWRVGARWYAPLLILPTLTAVVLLGLTALLSADFSPDFFVAGILFGLLAGFFEEIGWMGFAYPRLQLRYNALAAGIILGLLHATWHIAADYGGASQSLGVYWLPHFLAFQIVPTTALRILIVWVYSNTRSVLLSQLMHASHSGFLLVLGPKIISPANDTLWYAIYGLGMWIAVAAVVATYGKGLVRHGRVNKYTSTSVQADIQGGMPPSSRRSPS